MIKVNNGTQLPEKETAANNIALIITLVLQKL